MTWQLRLPAWITAMAIATGPWVVAGHISQSTAEAALRCSTSGRTVISTSTARVFTLRRMVRGAYGDRERARAYFGCVRRSRRVHSLRWYGEHLYRGFSQIVREPRLNAEYFLVQATGGDAHGWSFGAWNLATGRNTYQGGFDWETDEAVDMEVTAHGGIAWIEPWEGTVTKVDRAGRADLGRSDHLEPGTDGALSVDGDTVSWLARGVVERYVLDGAGREG